MLRSLLLLALCLASSSACDTDEALTADAASPFNSHNGLGGVVESTELLLTSSPLTLLPQVDGDESPACLDGSPYGFYFTPSKTGSTQWTISIEGGGWCYDEQRCGAERGEESALRHLPPRRHTTAAVHTLRNITHSHTHLEPCILASLVPSPPRPLAHLPTCPTRPFPTRSF